MPKVTLDVFYPIDPHFSSKNNFNFERGKAFGRSLGWLNQAELDAISKIKIGIAGLGGVGGQYAEIFARLGVSHFVISDKDQFSIENTNRQNGCGVSSYGRDKTEVIKEIILNINPQAKVDVYPQGLNNENIEEFCQKIDIYFDGLDFFAFDIRSLLFRTLRVLGKTAVTIAPIGTGAASLVFTPQSMSFDQYFGLDHVYGIKEKSLRFLVGLAPSLMQRKYLADSARVNFIKHSVPSLPMGVYSCASTAGTILLKFIRHDKIQTSPTSIHYDPYLQKVKKTTLWFGSKNPIYLLKVWIASLIINETDELKDFTHISS